MYLSTYLSIYLYKYIHSSVYLFNYNHLFISDLLPQEGGDGKQGECFRKISLDNQITTKSDKKVYVIFLSLIKTIRPFFPGWIINIVPGTKKGTV